MIFFKSLKARPLIILSQKEVRNVYKTLLEDDEHFEGWSLGHGYICACYKLLSHACVVVAHV